MTKKQKEKKNEKNAMGRKKHQQHTHKIGKTNEKKIERKEIERRIILFLLALENEFFLLVSSVENPSRCSCL